jgi:hypothetical protein
MIARASIKPQTAVLYCPDATQQSLASDLKGQLFHEGTITTEQPGGPQVRIVFTTYQHNLNTINTIVRQVPLWTLFPYPHNARYLLAETRTPAGYLDYDGYWVRHTAEFKIAIVNGANAQYLADRLRSGLHLLGGPAAQAKDLLDAAANLGVIPEGYGAIKWTTAHYDETTEPERTPAPSGAQAIVSAAMLALSARFMSLRVFQGEVGGQPAFHVRDLHTNRLYRVSVDEVVDKETLR